ncbi:MAG: hypothetical protein HN842_02940 [Gammaproteobacteria bacterium]|jgi:hypothetical protein|nr:hypothetical protein [Gammaproteobacteria bacterium]
MTKEINIVILSSEHGEINKGIDGMHGAPANNIAEALEVAKEYCLPTPTFIEEKGKPATKKGVAVGR